MLSERVAKKIFVWAIGLFILVSLLLSYLAGDLQIISNQAYWNIMLVLMGGLTISGIPWLLVMEGKQRRVALIGLGLSSAFYLIKIWFDF
ncbi:hypothetical protein [Ammoniphilus sp. YIM 78166]|uniref:hypothetical protein n=1 Tax=Ammoniphilus sp. YIM 78166 TaxID=1644106 RepID=UPI0010702EF9|nr:hypothetical protein [Ammoniphilus sp. YIM 78166]